MGDSRQFQQSRDVEFFCNFLICTFQPNFIDLLYILAFNLTFNVKKGVLMDGISYILP